MIRKNYRPYYEKEANAYEKQKFYQMPLGLQLRRSDLE